MKFKKLASLALAGAISFSLAAPTFAAGNETEITGTYTAPIIKVIVPPTAAAFINPLGLDVEVVSGTSVSGRQIISAPMALKNESASDLQVGASMTTTVGTGSDMRFVSTTTGGTGATKTVFAYLQAKQATDLVGATVTDANVAAAYAAWDASAYNAATDLVANTAMASTKDNLVILRAADVVGTTLNSYKAGSIALVRLAGDCVATPTTGSWAATTKNDAGEITGGDSFTVNVAYTFRPASIAKYDVTVPADVASPATSMTADLTKAAEGDTVTLTVTGTASSQVKIKAEYTPDGGSATAIDLTGTAGTSDATKELTWTINAGSTGSDLQNTITFTMPAGAVTITMSAT